MCNSIRLNWFGETENWDQFHWHWKTEINEMKLISILLWWNHPQAYKTIHFVFKTRVKTQPMYHYLMMHIEIYSWRTYMYVIYTCGNMHTVVHVRTWQLADGIWIWSIGLKLKRNTAHTNAVGLGVGHIFEYTLRKYFHPFFQISSTRSWKILPPFFHILSTRPGNQPLFFNFAYTLCSRT